MLNNFFIILKSAKNYLFYKIGKPRPFFCSYFVTFDCNLRCIYCPFFSKSLKIKIPRELRNIQENKTFSKTKKSKEVIDWLAKIGTVGISFTGGEPLLRDDLEEIAFYAKKKKMITFLNTNATLITKQRAKSLNGLFDVASISLAGGELIDDKLRGKNTFKRTVAGIKNLKENTRIKINLNTVINKENFREIEKVFRFARKNCNSITFLPIGHVSGLFLNHKEAKEVKKKIFFLKNKYRSFITNSKETISLFDKFLVGESPRFNCGVFDLYNVIWPDGKIVGCCENLFYAGTIFDKSPKEFIHLTKAIKTKAIDKCGSGCSTILYREISLLFSRPIYKNMISALEIFKKIS